MKSCPTCNRTYPDDTLAFCLIDGSILSAPYEPQTRQPYGQRGVEPAPTEILHSTHRPAETIPSRPLPPTMPSSSPVAYPANFKQSPPTNKSRGIRGLAAGIVLFLVMIAGLMIVLRWGGWLGSHNSTDKNPQAGPDVSSANRVPASTSRAVPQSMPSPENTPSPAAKLDVAGTWVGLSDQTPATLIIKNSENGSYEGIETISDTEKVQIAISVDVDSATRHITLKETRVIKGSGWNLGINNGSISSDGEKMRGTAKDTKGKVYSWSFSRNNSQKKSPAPLR
jgi:hypothetical protein